MLLSKLFIRVILLVFFTGSFYAYGQDCTCSISSDNLTVLNGETEIVNAYYGANSTAFTGATSISLAAERAGGANGIINAGDVLLVIQMQGVEINTTVPDNDVNDPYGDGPGGNDRSGYLETEDFIAGQYEYVIATNSITAAGGTLNIKTALVNSYIQQTNPVSFSTTQGRQTFQVVKVGNYAVVDIQAGGVVTGLPWDGTSGGIIVLDGLTSMTINGSINADFLGFRGGFRSDLDYGDGAGNSQGAFVSPFAEQTGIRGEGIAGTPLQFWGYNNPPLIGGTLTGTVTASTGYPGGEDTSIANPRGGNPNNLIYNSFRGPGAPGNAGGAGRGDDSGGGGSNGGFGGAGGGGDNGQGGDSLSLERARRAFLGGGGGSGGFENDDPGAGGYLSTVASGQPGGGIIIVRANAMTGTGTLSNNGGSGGVQDSEGSGGGGAGGTIILVTDTEDLNTLNVIATGGIGGSTSNGGDAGAGGGSGGNVLLVRRGGAFSAIPTVNVTGGTGGAGGAGDGIAGDGGFETTSIPPPATLDCPLINLPESSPGGVLQDLRLWLDAGENVNFNGSNEVSGWQGLSTNGFAFNNTDLGTTGGTPDFNSDLSGFNFNPAISFNNEGLLNDYLGFTNFSNFPTDNLTFFIVLNTSNTTGTQTAASYFDGTENDFNLNLSSTGNVAQQQIAANTTNGLSDIRDGFTRIITSDYINVIGVNDQGRVFINNLLETTNNFDGGQLTQNGQFVLGQEIDNDIDGGFDTSEAFIGEIAEVIVYFNDLLTDTERQKVSSYLAIKYGVTMDQSTNQDYLNSIGESVYPTLSNNADYGIYDNDIAGIGRDDGSALVQLKSKSINSDALLTVEKTGFSSDRQSFVWGNNDGLLTFNTDDISTEVSSRLAREWRVATRNGIENSSLSFDFSSGVTNVPPVGANLVLLVDGDGTFATGVTQTLAAGSWDGSTVTFDNVTLSNEDIFTVAVIGDSPGGVGDGLTLWLSSDQGTNTSVNNAEVTSWIDQSANATNLTSTAIIPANGEGGPSYNTSGTGFNGNPSLTFTDSHLSFSGYAFPADNITLFTVQTTTDLDFGGVFSYQINGDEYVVGGLSNLNIDVQGSAQDVLLNLADGEPQILTSDFDDPSNEGNVYQNGLLAGAGPTYTAAEGTDPAFQSGGLLTLGQETDNVTDGGFGATENFEGDIAEVILYEGVLNDTERNKIESYLAIKYGITLDQSTFQDYVSSNGDVVFPAKSSLPDFNSYANDIAGLGRDDQSRLNQTNSTSENNDAIVSMSVSSINSNSRFLVWGNDNDASGLGSTVGSLEEISVDVPSNVPTRLDREWRVANTNSFGEVTVTFDVSGVAVTGTTASDFTLLIDQDGDFTNGFVKSIEAVSFSANTVTFNNVIFDNNDIFTLGTSKVGFAPGGVINNIVSWLRADEGTSSSVDNTEVATWTDQSGLGNSGNTAGGNPLFRSNDANSINGNPVLSFDGVDDRLGIDLSSIANSNYALFGVGLRNTADDLQYVLGFDRTVTASANNLLHFGYRNNTSATLAQFGNDIDATVVAFDDPSTNPFIIYGEFFGTGHGIQENRNSTLVANSNGNTQGLVAANASDAFVGFRGTADFFNGNIAEVLAYSSELTALEETKIYSYLALKYGITMNSGNFDYTCSDGSTYYPSLTDTDLASYKTDIAGIGRDDQSNYEQLSSKSVNSSAILQVQKNTEFTADKQFFVWGTNSTALTADPNTTDVPSGIESRLDKEWRVKVTNNPDGTANFSFDLSNISASVSDPADLRLLIDADGVFNNATILAPNVIQNADTYTFENVNLSEFSDKDVFTLGSVSESDSPLPLDFISFSGKYENNKVSLTWETTNELNVSHFDVLRSYDGNSYHSIGEVNALNITNEINLYDYIDNDPGNENIYYQLEQYDFDGQNELSNVVFIQGADSENLFNAEIYPNPILNGVINIEFAGIGRAPLDIAILDTSGKHVWKGNYQSNDGSNQDKIEINSDLKSGIYIITFKQGLNLSRQRVIVK